VKYGELTPFLKFAFTEDWHDKLWLIEEADDPDDCLSFSENDDDDKFGLLRYLA
jgi:hypothetical protein